jgi:D-alanyl-D-alanine carboxypeptidase/D-alanyl-D-alanine-endopeptidase (penicillin-binding protein 4)
MCHNQRAMLRALLLVLIALAYTAPAVAFADGDDATKPADWNALLDQGDSARVHFGAVIQATPPFARNDTESFAPASTQKLFTAGAILAALGPSYTYPTILRWTQISATGAAAVTIVGAGDPSFGLEERGEKLRDRFDLIAQALRDAGVATIRGDVAAVASDARWNAISFPEGWKPDDASSCDGALAQAFNLSLNCATLKIVAPTKYAWAAEGLAFPVRLSIKPGPGTNLSVHFDGTAYRVEGTMAKDASPQSFTLPIHDTRAWAAALLHNALAAKGIRFVPGPRIGFGPSKQLVFNSAPLSELVKPFLKNSINVMGDGFLKILGAQSPGPLLPAGLARVNAFLSRYGDTRDLTLHDGSGLSRTARVTPAFEAEYLSRISGEAWFPALWDALPIAGVDGTLKNRMKGTPAEGKLRAKTGTLDGVYNLAGYVPRGNGFVPFVIYTRTTSDLSGPAKAAADRVGSALAALYADPGTPLAPPEPYPFVNAHAGMDAAE